MNVQNRESLGGRLGRFVGALMAVFVVTGAVVVSQRLSEDSLALLIGLACGVTAMLPTLGLGFLIWRREEARQQMMRSTPAASPPVIVVAPQALPGYAVHPSVSADQPWAAMPSMWQSAPKGRTFTVVGGEE